MPRPRTRNAQRQARGPVTADERKQRNERRQSISSETTAAGQHDNDNDNHYHYDDFDDDDLDDNNSVSSIRSEKDVQKKRVKRLSTRRQSGVVHAVLLPPTAAVAAVPKNLNTNNNKKKNCTKKNGTQQQAKKHDDDDEENAAPQPKETVAAARPAAALAVAAAPSFRSPPPSPRVTPYIEVVQERGGVMSPRETRSASAKKQRRSLIDEKQELQQQQQLRRRGALCFSPPNQAANARRERREQEEAKKQWDKKIAANRANGQLLEFSPSGRLRSDIAFDTKPAAARASSNQEQRTKDDVNEDEDDAAPMMDDDDDDDQLRAKEVMEENAKLTDRINALSEQNAAHAAMAAGLKQDEEKKLAEHNTKLAGLQESVDQLQEQVTHLESEKEQMSITNAALEQSLANAKSDIAKLQEDIDEMEKANEVAKQTVKTEKDNVVAENNRLVATIAELESRLHHEKNELRSQSEQQLTETQDLVLERENELEATKEELMQSQKTATQLQQDLSIKMAEMKQHEAELQNLREVNQQKKHEADELTKTMGDKNNQIGKLFKQLGDIKQELDAMKKSTAKLQTTLAESNSQLAESQSQLETTKSNLEQEQAMRQKVESELREAQRLSEMEAESKVVALAKKADEAAQQAKAHIHNAEAESRRYETEVAALKEQLATFAKAQEESEMELYRKLNQGEAIRRGLQARVMQMLGAIRVFVRVRPILPEERSSAAPATANSATERKRKRPDDDTNFSMFQFPGDYERANKKSAASAVASNVDDVTRNIIKITKPPENRGGLSERPQKHSWGFDRVFSPEHGQEEVWEAIEPLCQSAIDGYHCTIFAYGQTGSGKTFTLLGGNGQEGIITRAVKMLFQAKLDIEHMSRGSSSCRVSVEMIQIYNEKVQDLLVPKAGSKGIDAPLEVSSKDGVKGNVLVVEINSVEDFTNVILTTAQERRCVKATSSNKESSRSHMIISIHFDVTSTDGVTRHGQLNVCDLAGSERLGKSNAHHVGGALLEETKNINKSLHVLSKVIEELQAGSKNIPFRESALTKVLRNSLTGNSKTLAVVCCNPLASHYSETLSSLRFAASASKVELKAVASFKA